MKAFLALFITCFALMTIVGYQHGRALASNPEKMTKIAFQRVQIIRGKEEYVLAYKISKNEYFLYDVDSNNLYETSLTTASWSHGVEEKNLLSNLMFNPTISGALGGATLGFSVKDVLTKPDLFKKIWSKEGKVLRQKLLGGILGTISGHSFGFWMATRKQLPKPDDPRLINILKDEKSWQEQEWPIYANMHLNMTVLANTVEPLETRHQYTEQLKEISAKVLENRRSGKDITAADLHTLAGIGEKILASSRLSKSEEGREKGFFHWYVKAAAIASVIFFTYIGIAAFIDYWKESRKNEERKKRGKKAASSRACRSRQRRSSRHRP